MKKTYLQRGFTLIELLVVIAIIGILSSVVLASLNTARGKGASSAVKSNLANIRAQAEILYDTAGNYTGICTQATVAAQMEAAIKAGYGSTGTVVTAIGTAGSSSTVICHDGTSVYAISGPLKSPETGYWCVDSTGVSRGHANVLAANATVCPAS